MPNRLLWVVLLSLILIPTALLGAELPISEATQECLDCHASIHPGIVSGWQKSRHANVTPATAMAAEELARKVSSENVPEQLQKVVVGCAECHTLRPKAHADTFDHNGYSVHVVVSPQDCATCHSVEALQYSKNLMSHAWKNFAENKLYNDIERTISGAPTKKHGKIQFHAPDRETRYESCLYCHGTRLNFKGLETRDTDLGEMEFPMIEGWPNQGVGRVNLDGSMGACSACHTRHTFSIEMARKPYTCKECHVGPDVPAYKVYSASKHGNIFSSLGDQWDFKAVPWTIGEDFTAPTCAACHVSLTVNTDGEVISERTHQMNNRLAWRIFGLIYSHPHPREPDTSIIRNKNDQPLPTDLDGGFASKFLIDAKTQSERRQNMQANCLACHGQSWVLGHFKRHDNTIKQTNAALKTATTVMQEIWKQGFATGLSQGGSLTDEAIERKWAEIWLFYANSIRFASAMAGGGDYGVFADGRFASSQRIVEMNDWLKFQTQLQGKQPSK